MSNLIDAIKAIEPSAEISISNEDWDTIIWHNISPMDKDTVLAKQEELKTAYTNNAYQRNRKTEYPSIVDQLDDIYHNGIDAWKATIKAVKDKYPK
tara:strand:+ start:172 stop:459 length:288 start_codon:yes stop_codon:yes gene_type:complete